MGNKQDPGQGGIDRGKGDAELNLGTPSPELKEKMSLEFLPKDHASDPEDSELYGITTQDPKADPRISRSGTGGDVGDVKGESVLRRRWTAGQRTTVKKYFQEK